MASRTVLNLVFLSLSLQWKSLNESQESLTRRELNESYLKIERVDDIARRASYSVAQLCVIGASRALSDVAGHWQVSELGCRKRVEAKYLVRAHYTLTADSQEFVVGEMIRVVLVQP